MSIPYQRQLLQSFAAGDWARLIIDGSRWLEVVRVDEDGTAHQLYPATLRSLMRKGLMSPPRLILGTGYHRSDITEAGADEARRNMVSGARIIRSVPDDLRLLLLALSDELNELDLPEMAARRLRAVESYLNKHGRRTP